jgi:RNA polymerase sigma factor (sigma-70 family)
VRNLETSWDLLQQACAGAEPARRALATRYGPALAAYFRRRGVDAHHAEDLTQVSFIRLFGGALQQADPSKGSFRGLLATIAFRVWSSDRRSQEALRRGGGAEVLDVHDMDVPDQGAEEVFDREWFSRLLELALTRLADEHPSYYDAIDACLVREESQPEFAAAAGCALQDVRNRVFRGRQKLHAYLAELISAYAPEQDQHATELRFLAGALGLERP